MHKTNKILILGSNGMLGHTLFYFLRGFKDHRIFGLQRVKIKNSLKNNIIIIKKFDQKNITKIIKKIRPKFVINCVGVINHKINKNNVYDVFYINSVFPRIISKISSIYNFKFIHISTDCVFSGKKGNYYERNLPDAEDAKIWEPEPSTIYIWGEE